MTHTDWLRRRCLERAGLWPEPRRLPSMEQVRRTEWSPRFERLMRNRLVLGALRYGLIHAPGKPRYDRIGRARHELDAYATDGNLERLVDIANMMLLEFEEGRHPLAHWGPQDDTGLHTAILRR